MATIAVSQRSAFSGTGLARAVIIALILAILIATTVANGGLAVYWAFGITFGVILQRSRLCFASGFRDLFLLRDAGNLRSILAGIAVASLGFALIEARAVPTPG
ncbi:MAG TPA: hypothetical protein VFZ25_00275, partial [Chloroflexota bacterium]|nr:hypothetical protein [Chloroflexota bacterium]